MSPKRITKPLDVYVRVSDVRGRAGEGFISPRDQEARCRSLAASRGYTIGDVFTDLDVSGGKMSRPELDRVIDRVAKGVSGGILVAKLDRFARTLVGGLQTLERIADLGGVVIVADGDFDTSTATGELVLNMMLSLAQFELRRIRENWNSAQRHAVEESGIHISRHVPPGYRRRDDRRLEPDTEHARTLQEAFSRAASGESYTEIAEMLTARRFPSGGRSGTWLASRVSRLLSNRVYLGEARYGGIVNENAHEPLVSPELWLLAQRKARRVAPRHSEFLLSGLCRCAECLYAMKPQRERGRAVGTYRCQTTTISGRCPHPVSVSMTRLDEYVIGCFLERADVGFVGEAVVGGEESTRLFAKAVDAERSYRAALTNIELRRQIGDVDHGVMVASLHEAWRQALATAEAARPNVSLLHDMVSLREHVEHLRSRGEIAELRGLLASGVETILVRPAKTRARTAPIADRVEIVWLGERSLDLPRRGRRFERTPASARV